MKHLKVIINKKTRVFLVALVMPFLLSSCNSGNKKQVDNSTKTKEMSQITTDNQEKETNYKYEIVSNDKVCMVNDRYMYVKQLPVEVDGITYYGCCENCVDKIQNNEFDVRYAKDPITGERVDKASAIIVQNKKNGVVFYFGTKELADSFIKTQG